MPATSELGAFLVFVVATMILCAGLTWFVVVRLRRQRSATSSLAPAAHHPHAHDAHVHAHPGGEEPHEHRAFEKA